MKKNFIKDITKDTAKMTVSFYNIYKFSETELLSYISSQSTVAFS